MGHSLPRVKESRSWLVGWTLGIAVPPRVSLQHTAQCLWMCLLQGTAVFPAVGFLISHKLAAALLVPSPQTNLCDLLYIKSRLLPELLSIFFLRPQMCYTDKKLLRVHLWVYFSVCFGFFWFFFFHWYIPKPLEQGRCSPQLSGKPHRIKVTVIFPVFPTHTRII